MRTIVAGRTVTSESEYVEAAFGFDFDTDFTASLLTAPAELQADFLQFMEDTSDPANDIDRVNVEHLRRVLGIRPPASVVLMPRTGTARLTCAKGVRAA